VREVYTEGLNDDGLLAWREQITLLRELPARLKSQIGKPHPDFDEIMALLLQISREVGAAGTFEAGGDGRALPLEEKEGGEVEERDRAIVKRLLAAGPCALVILGGGHNLTAEVERKGRGAEYLRVEVSRYPPP
jgi:hypothetical protein